MRSILLLIAVLAAACGPRAAPQPSEPAPAPRPASATVAQRPPIRAEACRCMTMCIVQNGELRDIPIAYNIATRDTMTRDSLPITQVAPLTGEYASVAGWYVNGGPIRFRGRRYTQSGQPRVLGIPEVQPAGAFEGVPVFAEAGDTASAPGFVYLPFRPGCEFQPYALEGGR